MSRQDVPHRLVPAYLGACLPGGLPTWGPTYPGTYPAVVSACQAGAKQPSALDAVGTLGCSAGSLPPSCLLPCCPFNGSGHAVPSEALAVPSNHTLCSRGPARSCANRDRRGSRWAMARHRCRLALMGSHLPKPGVSLFRGAVAGATHRLQSRSGGDPLLAQRRLLPAACCLPPAAPHPTVG